MIDSCEQFRGPKHGRAVLLASAMFLLTWLVLLPAGSQATHPGDDGRIVFVTDRDGNNEIYSMASDGTDLQRLTDNPANDRDPAVSADGERIAFTSDRDGEDEIFVMSIDGEDPVNLTDNTDADRQPTWSPDGSQIAFATDRHPNAAGFEIWTMTDSGATPTRRTPNGGNNATDSNPSWSPDGSRLAFERFIPGGGAGQGGGEIYAMNSTGGGQINLTDNTGIEDRNPDFSPNVANQIVFESNRGGDFQIYTLEPGGGGFPVTQITDDDSSATAPVFSPSGDLVTFVSDRDGDPEIYSATVGGGNPDARLTETVATDTAPAWQAVEADAPPEVTFEAKPETVTSSGEAEFQFSSSTGISFECRLDSDEESAFEPCVSPVALSDLEEGSHTFEVRATDTNDLTGSAQYQWTVDQADPETTITSGPTDPSAGSSAQFAFSSNEPGVTFQCRLDSSDEGAFSPCASPKVYGGLAAGAHVFEVRAVDGAGNTDPSPASHEWAVVATPVPTGSELLIRTVSSRPDMVSDDDALIEIRLPDPDLVDELVAKHEGQDITADLAPLDADQSRLRVLIEDLPVGPSEVTAEIPGYPQAQLILVDHPRTGPIFSGPHQEPFICQTEEFGVGEPIDEDCSIVTQYSYMYRDNTNTWVPLADPTAPYPADGQMTTTNDGKTVPYAIRIERGTINRAIYAIAVLIDVGPGSDQSRPGEGWNRKLLFNFGGGCKAGFTQGEPEIYSPNNNVGTGYATAESSLNVFANRCSDAVSAETLAMIKEHFIEEYGEPKFTIGSGGSGGAMAQYMINDNYPGLLDGSTVSHSFVDNAYAANTLMDCRVIDLYLTANGGGWSNAQKNAVNGPKQNNGCKVLWQGFGRNFFNPTFCPAALPTDLIYNAVSNPTGARCTITEGNINVWGIDPQTGFARMPIDNIGVTYGLEALNDGVISVEQFLHLNENTGSINHDNETLTSRVEADPETLRIAYQQGQIVSGGAGLSYTPMIDNRSANNDNQATNPHHIVQPLSVRERIIRANGDAGTHVIWTSPSGGVGNVVATMDEWLENIAADGTDRSAREKALDAKPEDAVDRCFDGAGNVIAEEPASFDSGVCGSTYPSFSLPRMKAGGPLANDVLKCQLKPVDFSEYPEMTVDERNRMLAAFPDGVCDYTKPGVEQFVSRDTWRVYPKSAEADEQAPDTAISSVPPLVGAPDTVRFQLSASETGAEFECSLDDEPFASCSAAATRNGLSDGEHTFEARAVDLAGNPDDSPASVTFVVGDTEPVGPVVELSEVTHDFGVREIGSGSTDPSTFQLNNSGDQPAEIGQVALGGPDPGDFPVFSDTCSNMTVVPGASCAISVSFAPTAAGNRSASVNVASNAPGSPHSVTLSGTGKEVVPPPPPPPGIKPRVRPRTALLRIGGNGKAWLPVRCSASPGEKCTGHLALRVRKRALGIKRGGWTRVVSRKYSIAPGKRTITARVGKRVRRAVKKRRKIQAKLRIVTRRTGSPNLVVHRKIRIRAR